MSLVNLVGGPSILLNLILVDAEVRPAMLFQPVNFGEWNSTDPITMDCLYYIKQEFPNLIYSDNYTPFQGIIISKHHDYTGKHNINSTEMGAILGYPCYSHLQIIREREDDPYTREMSNIHTINIVVIIQERMEYIELFSNVSIGDSLLDEFDLIAQNARLEFTNKKYASLLLDTTIKSVKVVNKINITSRYLLDKLVSKDELTTDDLDGIIGYMWNLNDSMLISKTIINEIFEPTNKIHKGMLMGIMFECIPRYDRYSPIYGQNTTELSHFNEIRRNWFTALQELFTSTRNKPKRDVGCIQYITNYIMGNRLISEASGPVIEIMKKIFNKQLFTNTDKRYIYKGFMNISEENPLRINDIINIYESYNEYHIGFMLILLFEFIPRYNLNGVFQLIDQTTVKYIRFKHICKIWIEEVYRLFVQTSQKSNYLNI